MTDIEMTIVRAGAWLVLVLCLFALLVILDIWRHRREAQGADIAIMVILSASLLCVGGIFGRCAYTGQFPCAKESRP